MKLTLDEKTAVEVYILDVPREDLSISGNTLKISDKQGALTLIDYAKTIAHISGDEEGEDALARLLVRVSTSK